MEPPGKPGRFTPATAFHDHPVYWIALRPLGYGAIGLGAGVLLIGLAGLPLAARRRAPVWASASASALVAGSLVLLPAAPLRAAPQNRGLHSDPLLIYGTDHLGSVRVVLDHTAALLEARDYAPFGASTSHDGNHALRHQFTGQEWKEADDLYDYGARYYNPSWGRFVSPDELIQGADGQAIHPYTYTVNRPTSLVDSTGNFADLGSFAAAIQAASSHGALGLGFFSLNITYPAPDAASSTTSGETSQGIGGVVRAVAKWLFDAPAALIIGILVGNVMGVLGGFGEALGGAITRNRKQFLAGLQLMFQSLTPRFDLHGGLGYGEWFENLPAITATGGKFPGHDESYIGTRFFSPAQTPLDIQLMSDLWGLPVLTAGPVEVAVRASTIALFGAKVAGQQTIGRAAWGAFDKVTGVLNK